MLIYHKITEEEKFLISEWKYCGNYEIYNNAPYEVQKEKGSGFANPQNNFYSFYDKNILIGYINLREKDNRVSLGIGVHPQYCNKGYGQQMVSIACKIAETLFGEKLLELEVRTWNTRAIRCYEKSGFHIEGTAFHKTTPIGEGQFYRMVTRTVRCSRSKLVK